jgi:hypothetical protein
MALYIHLRLHRVVLNSLNSETTLTSTSLSFCRLRDIFHDLAITAAQGTKQGCMPGHLSLLMFTCVRHKLHFELMKETFPSAEMSLA